MDPAPRAAERRSLRALGALSIVAIVGLVVVLAFGTGHAVTTALFLLPVIALPALSPLAFCAWAFASDTNR
jgi:hypothetical protein